MSCVYLQLCTYFLIHLIHAHCYTLITNIGADGCCVRSSRGKLLTVGDPILKLSDKEQEKRGDEAEDLMNKKVNRYDLLLVLIPTTPK